MKVLKKIYRTLAEWTNNAMWQTGYLCGCQIMTVCMVIVIIVLKKKWGV